MRFILNNLPSNYIEWLKIVSKRARANIIKMTSVANSGHPGGSMSSIDFYITTILFSNIFNNFLKINSGEIDFSEYNFEENEKKSKIFSLTKDFFLDKDIDSFIISHGHTSPGWYSALVVFGLLDEKEVNSGFRLSNSPFSGHVENIIPLVEWDTGNLGQGLSAAAAKALYYKKKSFNSHVWVFMGDGEQQKGQISEARRFIKKYGLTNITVIIDYNKLQISGNIEKVMPQNLKSEWEAGGFYVVEIDGHDFNEIYKVLKTSYNDKNNNYCILARTVMGKGVSFMENKEKYHGATLPLDLAKKALEELKEFDDLDELLRLRKEYNFENVKNKLLKIWDRSLRTKKRDYFNNCISKLSDKPFNYYGKDKSIDCRSAYGEELLEIAKEFKQVGGNIFVFDCDLAESVKTNSFEKEFKEDFIQTGIQEHHAATCAGFLSKENALVFFSDFAIFGLDETFNQQRLNDINECNLKAVYTHAGTNVGEDGKTHHCINYIALTSCFYNSMLILPCDPNHTKHVLRYIAKRDGNFYVVMGRAKSPIVLDKDGNSYFNNNYIFTPGIFDIFYEGFDQRFKNDLNYKDIKADIFLISCGPAFSEAYLAYEEIKYNINVALVNISTPNYIDEKFLDIFSEMINNKIIIVTEDHNIKNGLNTILNNIIIKKNIKVKKYNFGITDYAPSGDYKSIYRKYGIDKDSIVKKIKSIN
ncbi:MAG: transketolase [Spirochaetes bacterium]|nr:transketolase [Spirochaetota bacterium]